MLKQLSPEEKRQEPMQHALKVRIALAQGNYCRFFKLYRDAPNSGANLIDVFIDKIRILSLRNLAMGYIATGIDIEYLSTTHGFDTVEECEKFLRDNGCTIVTTTDGLQKKLDCRASIKSLRNAQLKVRRTKK